MDEAFLWNKFKRNKLALFALFSLFLLALIGIYAPFFASSKPIAAFYEGHFYFPLFRYLFYKGFFSKPIDLFFNVLMFTLPLFILGWGFQRQFYQGRGVKVLFVALFAGQLILTFILSKGVVKDPARNLDFIQAKEKGINRIPDFDRTLAHMNTYEKLNLLVQYKERKAQSMRLTNYATAYFENSGRTLPLLYELNQQRELEEKEYLESTFRSSENELQRYAKARLEYLEKKRLWLENESSKMAFLLMPLFRSFHWEEDAGGGQESNSFLPWWERTRLNRKDLTASLIFGIRVSLLVGFSAVFLSLIIGVPLGLFAGYFAGKVDMITLRFIEIWEAMPIFFTLLLISAIMHSKSLLLTVLVLGLFGWTGFARFIRAEVLRERNLPYVMATKSIGFPKRRIMFKEVLPNAISPVIALLPFSMMSAITAEAGLSFLGLGEEGSTSWGVLMSEARSVFPGESYLLWPPALLLTILLVSIALVGDGLRDALDPKTE